MTEIEIVTWPKKTHSYYKITNNALCIKMRGNGVGAVGLSREPGLKSDYYIVIEGNYHGGNKCRIYERGSQGRSAKVTDSSPNENNPYKSVTISWHSMRVAVTCHPSNNSADLKLKYPDLNYQYVTFMTTGSDTVPLYWKILLPPIRPRCGLKPLTDSPLRWQPASETLPTDAVLGGFEKGCLFIMRAPHRASLTPGKYLPALRLGVLAWGGQAHEKAECEILCGYDCQWVRVENHKLPENAFIAGYSEVNHEALFIGRSNHKESMVPGKIQLSHKCCYIPLNGAEIAKTVYEVLVTCNQPRSIDIPWHFDDDVNQYEDFNYQDYPSEDEDD